MIPDIPLTPRQEAYVRELEAYETVGMLPAWEQKRSDLEAEHLSLHAQALPPGATSDAEDLFDLLEDQAVETTLDQVMVGDQPRDLVTPSIEPIGVGREQIPIAEVRRTLTVGSRVQVFYLAQQREQTAPDVRTVSKQTGYEMVTTSAALPKGSHMHWAGATAERDSNGILILRDPDGTPCVAYKPLTADDPEPTEAVLPIDPVLRIRYAEAGEATDPATLEEIARSDHPLNRRRLAENPHTSATILERLAADANVHVRRAVAGNPRTPEAALDRLADDPDKAPPPACKVTWLVANNPSTPPPTLLRLTVGADPTVLAAIGRNSNTPSGTLEQLATPPAGRLNPDIRQAIASNPNTPGHILAGWENSDGWTKPQIAKNPSTPPEVLERLSHDTSTGNSARAQAATNPSLPVSALFRLAHDDVDAWVREHAARNPNIDAAHSHRVALDMESRVRRALAGNEHVSPAVLECLQADPDPAVRASLARNPGIRPETLQALADDRDPKVRAGVTRNPAAPTAILERLADQLAAKAEHAPPWRPALKPPDPHPTAAGKQPPSTSAAATQDVSGGGVRR